MKDGKYTHEVHMRVGDRPWMKYSRPEIVFAFSEKKAVMTPEEKACHDAL